MIINFNLISSNKIIELLVSLLKNEDEFKLFMNNHLLFIQNKLDDAFFWDQSKYLFGDNYKKRILEEFYKLPISKNLISEEPTAKDDLIDSFELCKSNEVESSVSESVSSELAVEVSEPETKDIESGTHSGSEITENIENPENTEYLYQTKLRAFQEVIFQNHWNIQGLFGGKTTQLNKDKNHKDDIKTQVPSHVYQMLVHINEGRNKHDFCQALYKVVIEAIKASNTYSIFRSQETKNFYNDIFIHFGIDVKKTLENIGTNFAETNNIKSIIGNNQLSDHEKLKNIFIASKNKSPFFSFFSAEKNTIYPKIMDCVVFNDMSNSKHLDL